MSQIAAFPVRAARAPRSALPVRLRRTTAITLLALCGLAGATTRLDPPPSGRSVGAPGPARLVASSFDYRLLAPEPLLGSAAQEIWSAAAPLSALLVPTAGESPARVAALAPAEIPQRDTAFRAASAAGGLGAARPAAKVPDAAGLLAAAAPGPGQIGRPAAATPLPRLARRLPGRRTRVAQSAPVDNRSFFERLLGLPIEAADRPASALAYAALENTPVEPGPIRRLNVTPAGIAGIAIYDIRARTVTLPSGERLEAHSGLGGWIDDPAYTHMRMRGATPPGTYDLTLREALFHGVRALRLNPVGGNSAVFGRAGLLAHTFMLGPSGQSNGCVSFRDYDRFLQAYLRGDIRRLVVVSGDA